jgi:hypothetical protein
VVAKSKRGVLTFECHADKTHDTSALGGGGETGEAPEPETEPVEV